MQLSSVIAQEGTILTAFETACERYPDKTGLIFLGTRFTYSQLRDLVYRFAASSTDLEIGINDRVLIYLPSCPQWLVAYLGLQKIGAIPVPVSPIYTPWELSYLINHSGSGTILCADTNFGYVKDVLRDTHLKWIIATNITDLLPLWKRAFGKIFDKVREGSVSSDRNVRYFKKIIRHDPTGLPRIDFEPGAHPAHILYTGGTTGFPKGVPHTHLELLSGIVGIREVYRRFIEGGEHTLIMPLPLFHMFSQDMVFALGLHLGNTVVIAPKPNTDAVLAAIQEYRGTLLAGVPSLYRQILENDRLEFYDLGSLKYCWSAGDVLPVEVSNRWKEKFRVPIYQVYGSTETVCISVSPLDREPAPANVGVLLPTRQAKVVDPETLTPVSFNRAGELLVSSDYSYVAGGYWDNQGVPHTHLELLSGIVGIREVYRRFIEGGEHTLIMPLPLFHMFSQDMVFALGLHLGNTVVIAPKPNTDAVLAAIQEYRGTLLAGVPSLYRQILENDRLEFYDLGSLKYCWSAGDVLPVEVSNRWKEKFRVPIYQVYGSTETVCISVSPLDREPAPANVGVLLPTRQAKVVDPETLTPVSFNRAGELLISSDYSYVAGGYWDNPTETKQTYVEIDGKTWCRQRGLRPWRLSVWHA